MKTIFLTVYDGDTEKVILRSGAFERLVASGNRLVLLVRGADRLPYYKKEFERENVHVELLAPAMTPLERAWYHLGWNTIPTHSVRMRRRVNYRKHRNMIRYGLECLAGWLGRFRAWREFLRQVYRFTPDTYAAGYFESYQPDLVFTPNMFSPEDLRILRAAKRRRIPTVATAKSWDVLTTKAFTRVKADRLLVFNEFNREEAVTIGDYAPNRVIVTGFPQYDGYADTRGYSRSDFLDEMDIDPSHRLILFGVPGNWLAPYTHEILTDLDARIERGDFRIPITVLARLHPKYPDETEHHTFQHILVERPGTSLAKGREFSVDMAVPDVYQWTFTDTDIVHLRNSILASDVVVNTASTLTLDAAALDRPTVLIAYDGDHTLSHWDSVARIYEREHYRHVVDTGACPLVRSGDELASALDRFLTDPEYLRSERNALKEQLLYKTDGNSAHRTADAVLSLLS